MRRIDLNCDLGEGFGSYRNSEDESLLDTVTSANIACGFHAGDPHTMRETVERCANKGVSVGAHPGLPDLLGFGRREMQVTPREAEDFILYQVGALQAFARSAGVEVKHLKLHGALYHMAARDIDLAQAAARAARQLNPKLIVIGPPDSEIVRAAANAGLRTASEAFADRAYLSDGGLAPRSMADSVLKDPAQALAQSLELVCHGRTGTLDGGSILLVPDTLCVHGDVPGAAGLAAYIRHGLEESGCLVRAL